jgi:toxin ParE1/3/4
MKYSFKISRLALNDLDDIWHYTIENWSKQQANEYYKQFFAVID